MAVVCKAQSSSLFWFILKGQNNAPITAQFTNKSPHGPLVLAEGIEGARISPKSDPTISSKLKLDVPLNLLPVIIFCGSSFQQKKIVSLQLAGNNMMFK